MSDTDRRQKFYGTVFIDDLEAALRQRAEEATRAENEACAKLQSAIGSGIPATTDKAEIFAHGFRLALDMYAAAIRARITPKGQGPDG